MLQAGAGPRAIMAEIGCGAALVYRIKSEMEADGG
jgi:hypothetical protein